MNDPRDIENLIEAKRIDPFDPLLRLALADAYESVGKTDLAAKERRCAEILALPANADIRERLEVAVENANGDLRARRIDYTDGKGAVRKALWNADFPAHYVDGGGVANSYGYRAYTALVLVYVRKDGKICVDGGQAQARKDGGSPANVWQELVQWKAGAKALLRRLEQWAQSR